MSAKDNLHAFFYPETVAVIGASASPGKVGHTIVRNMLDAGFKGKIFPVNPKASEIEGLTVVNDIADLPRGLDLGVISVPQQFVVPSLEALAEIGTKQPSLSLPVSRKSARTGIIWSRRFVKSAKRTISHCSVPIVSA